MKRGTLVPKPQRGEQKPFSRQLANERKENQRLRDENSARLTALKRKHGEHLAASHANLVKALADYDRAVDDLRAYSALHRDFARVAPVLRSRSRLRRLWWGIRFGLWGAFGFEVQKEREV